MARFTYKTKNKDGEISKRTASAKDKFDLYDQVRKEGLEIIEVHEEGKGILSVISTQKFNEFFGAVKEHEKVILTRNLAAMIGAGLSLTRALTVLERQTKNQKLKMVLDSERWR